MRIARDTRTGQSSRRTPRPVVCHAHGVPALADGADRDRLGVREATGPLVLWNSRRSYRDRDNREESDHIGGVANGSSEDPAGCPDISVAGARAFRHSRCNRSARRLGPYRSQPRPDRSAFAGPAQVATTGRVSRHVGNHPPQRLARRLRKRRGDASSRRTPPRGRSNEVQASSLAF